MLIQANVKDNFMVVCEVKDDGSCVAIKDLLADSSVTLRYPNLLLTPSSLDVPFLKDLTAVNLEPVISLFMAKPDSITEESLLKIKSALDGNLDLPIEAYRGMLECTKQLINYINGNEKVSINFPIENYDNYQNTKRLVDSINQKSELFNVQDNETKFRKTPDDELFIYVPRPDALSYTDNYFTLIPSMKTVFDPYRDPRLATHEYKLHLVKAEQSIEEVVGNPSNNTKEIFSEEKRYYDALCALHDSCLKIKYPDKDIEDCRTHKVSSESFRDYITSLIVSVVTYHWNHSGYMPLEIYSEGSDDDDDGDDTAYDSIGSDVSAGVSYSVAKKADSDGIDIIENLVKNEIRKDIYGPIRLLIQCLRFGNKKPSKISLTEEKSYFDLNYFVYSSSSGSYDSYEVKKTPSGCNYSVASLINANNRLVDTKFIQENRILKNAISCPVGLLLQKSFKDSDDKQLIVLSIVDLITWLGKDKDLTIEGVSFSDGNVFFDPSKIDKGVIDLDLGFSIQDIDSRLQTSSNGSVVSYASDYLKDAYLSANSFNNNLNILSIYNSYIERTDLSRAKVFEVISEEELKVKVTEYQSPPGYILNATVGLKMCKLIAQVNNEYFAAQEINPYVNINDLMKIYVDCMKEQGYYGEVYSMDMITGGSPLTSSNDNISKSTAFSASENEKVDDRPREVKATNPSMEEATNGNYYDLNKLYHKTTYSQVTPILLEQSEIDKVNKFYSDAGNSFRVVDLGPHKGSRIVGYLSMVNGKYVFLEPKQYNLQAFKRLSLVKFKSNVLGILRKISMGEESAVKFESPEVLAYYCKILEKC